MTISAKKNEIRNIHNRASFSPDQVRSVVLSVIKKLSTDELCLIPHVGAHPRPWKNVSPPTAGVSGAARCGGEIKKKKKKTGEGEKDAKNGARCSAAPIENHARCVVCFFLHVIGIRAARSLSLPAFQRFPAFFFCASLLKDGSIFLRVLLIRRHRRCEVRLFGREILLCYKWNVKTFSAQCISKI